MNLKSIVKVVIFAVFVYSYYYSYSHQFEEASITVEIKPKEREEICINTSSSFVDLWNNRYLHIDSNEKSYNLYSKRTIFFEILNDKHVADQVKLSNKKTPYSVYVRMYFSRCYIIENTSTESPLKIQASTSRSFCTWNATIMLCLIGFVLFLPKMFIKELVFFGVSLVCLFIAVASGITYLPQKLFTLPGFQEITESLVFTILCISFYSIFITSVMSFILRIFLNYYHFAYHYLHYIPRIVSTLGPYLCHYQEWVIGLYIAMTLYALPKRNEWVGWLIIPGLSLVAILYVYGGSTIKSYMMGGLIISVIVVTMVYLMWILGYSKMFPQQTTDSKKKD